METRVLLRGVTDSDLPVFFEQQLDPAANTGTEESPPKPSRRSLVWKNSAHSTLEPPKTILPPFEAWRSVGSRLSDLTGALLQRGENK